MIRQADTNHFDHLVLARQIRNDYLSRLCAQIGHEVIAWGLPVARWYYNRYRLLLNRR